MTAETARKFASLEAQASRIMAVFANAGYEAVAPAIIQPADVFLDAVGEALRARTYVFADQDGAELCLRPDLTVPACRLHLERTADGSEPAKYCYNGPAFRFQPAGAGSAHPREFRQAGIESFGAADRTGAEAEVLALTVEAVDAAGLSRRALHMRFGDLEMVRALLEAAPMPSRWRRRLQAQYWQPAEFRAELKRLAEDPAGLARGLPEPLRTALHKATQADAEAQITAHLEASGQEPFGARRIAEVAENALAIAEDARAHPLDARMVELIESYVAIRAPAQEAATCIRTLAKTAGVDLTVPLARFEERLARFDARGLDLDAATFSGDFGRALEYYTGFVFEIGGPGLGANSPIAGGGRYDGLMRMAGSRVDVPAVGAAIHTERLLSAIAGSGAGDPDALAAAARAKEGGR